MIRPSCNFVKKDGLWTRPGFDHDPIKPGMHGDYGIGHRVEVLSFPVPHKDADGAIDHRSTLMVRMTPGDPTTLREVPITLVAVYCPSRNPEDAR